MKDWIHKFLGRNDKNGHMKGDKRRAILLISHKICIILISGLQLVIRIISSLSSTL